MRKKKTREKKGIYSFCLLKVVVRVLGDAQWCPSDVLNLG